MKTIIWDGRHGLTLPEGRVREEAQNLLAQLNAGEICIGQGTILNELRIAIKQGKVEGPVQVIVDGRAVPINSNGVLLHWPRADGFELVDEQLTELLEWNK